MANRYFAELFAAFREMDIESDPLDAELAVSRMFGHMWLARDIGADADELCEGLVQYAADQHTPVALALLRTIAVVGPTRALREFAVDRAEELASRGVQEPRWSTPVGAVKPGRCWANEDVYGDQTSVICEYAYGEQRHATVVLVDHNLYGIAKGAFPVDRVDATVRELRREAMKNGPMITLREVEPSWARGLLEPAFARTDVLPDAPVEDDFADWHALALARVRALPAPEPGMAPSEPQPLKERRALVRQFLRSPEASDLDARDAEHLVSLIVDYGCDNDMSQPERVSPAKWELFLLGWLPRHAALGPAERRALPDVVRAWSRWAAQRSGLPLMAREELATAVERLLAVFDVEYDNPANFGPARMLLAQLPDDPDLIDGHDIVRLIGDTPARRPKGTQTAKDAVTKAGRPVRANGTVAGGRSATKPVPATGAGTVKAATAPVDGAAPASYQIKITLRDTKPPIWRRVLVPAGVTLADLHRIVQVAMGWQDSHLHLFEVGTERYGMPDPDDDLLELRDERRVRLDDVVSGVGARLRYEYDFGDSWEHDILIEKVFSDPVPAAVCLAGRRACPPEDCGGAYGYERLMRILADPTNEEHDDLVDWLEGEAFNPAELDLDTVNAALSRLRLRVRR